MNKLSIILIFIFTLVCVVAYAQGPLAQPTVFTTSSPVGACIVGTANQYNTTTGELWGCKAGTWTLVGGAGVGTVTSVGGGCGLSGGPITSTGTLARSEAVNAQSGTSYTAVNGDCGKLVTFTNSSAIAVTLPQANGSTFVAGWALDISNLGVGTVTITPTTSTIDGASTLTVTTNQGVRIVSDGTNYFTVRGQGGGGGGGNPAATVSVSFSATPTFTCPSSTGTAVTFYVGTITSAITSSTLSSCGTNSQVLTFVFPQDGTGHSVAYPTGFSGVTPVNARANAQTTVTVRWDGTTATQTDYTVTGIGDFVSLPEQASDPTGVTGNGLLYTKTDHKPYLRLNAGAADEVCTFALGCANVPISTGVTGLGTGVASKLANAPDAAGGLCSVGGSGCPSGSSPSAVNPDAPYGYGGGGGPTNNLLSNTVVWLQQFTPNYTRTDTRLCIQISADPGAAKSVIVGIGSYPSGILISGVFWRGTGSFGTGSYCGTLGTAFSAVAGTDYYFMISTEDTATFSVKYLTSNQDGAQTAWMNDGSDIRKGYCGGSTATGTGVLYAFPGACASLTVDGSDLVLFWLLP